ncbi:MAG: hypothetical protein ACREI9_02275 [Nitrospiraceae bacterium]
MRSRRQATSARNASSAARASGVPNTEFPATNTSAPASRERRGDLAGAADRSHARAGLLRGGLSAQARGLTAVFHRHQHYPTIHSLPTTSLDRGYHGQWHTLDTRPRLGLPEPSGRPFAEVFDDAMRHFVDGKPFPADPGALN